MPLALTSSLTLADLLMSTARIKRSALSQSESCTEDVRKVALSKYYTRQKKKNIPHEEESSNGYSNISRTMIDD